MTTEDMLSLKDLLSEYLEFAEKALVAAGEDPNHMLLIQARNTLALVSVSVENRLKQ